MTKMNDPFIVTLNAFQHLIDTLKNGFEAKLPIAGRPVRFNIMQMLILSYHSIGIL